jgi:mRNA-degrading endonuclease YafQ of YafQ-DinJ toxin-antitoxin module
MFVLKFSKSVSKSIKKYIKGNSKLEKSFIKTLEILRLNPFHNSLNTHKVDTKRNKDVWSSRINGDWRVAWIFDEETKSAIIICVEIGTHSGSSQMYNSKSS